MEEPTKVSVQEQLWPTRDHLCSLSTCSALQNVWERVRDFKKGRNKNKLFVLFMEMMDGYFDFGRTRGWRMKTLEVEGVFYYKLHKLALNYRNTSNIYLWRRKSLLESWQLHQNWCYSDPQNLIETKWDISKYFSVCKFWAILVDRFHRKSHMYDGQRLWLWFHLVGGCQTCLLSGNLN